MNQLNASNLTISELVFEKQKYQNESIEASKNVNKLTNELVEFKIKNDQNIAHYQSIIQDMNEKHSNIVMNMTNLKNENSNITVKIN